MTCPDFEVRISIPLQCTRCGETECTQLEEPAIGELNRKGSTQRHCSSCKCLVDFTRTKEVAKPAGVEPDLLVTAQEIFAVSPEGAAERHRSQFRIHPRNMKACIRYGERRDLATVVDYCRTGLHISSAMLYELGCTVEVATDFIEGGVNIFQRARVVSIYCRPMPEQPGGYELVYQ